MVRIVEVEALGSHLNVLFQHLLSRHVAEDDVLRVDRQDGKAIGDAARILLLLLFQASLKIFKGLCIGEFLVAHDVSDQTIARDDIALDNLSQAFEVVVVADDQSASNG